MASVLLIDFEELVRTKEDIVKIETEREQSWVQFGEYGPVFVCLLRPFERLCQPYPTSFERPDSIASGISAEIEYTVLQEFE